MFQAITTIPSPYIFDYPLKVMIRIHPDGFMTIFPDGIAPIPTRITIPPDELANLNQQLQDAAAAIAISNASASEYSPAEMNQELRTLAELGYYAYKKIFADPEAKAFFDSLLPDGSIEIVSENFVIPWQLLYPTDDIKAPITCTNFWGLQHIITHILVGTHHRLGAPVPAQIDLQQAPHVGLVAYNKLPAVINQEIPFFEQLDHDHHIQLNKLRALNAAHKSQELAEFCKFWKTNKFQIAHFACHAEYSPSGPNLSEITLSNDFTITFQDMVIHSFEINGYPLIIMNACETNTLNPQYSSHFAALFLEQQARGVVTTEAEIPDTFAADFIKHLYQHLLSGTPIGTSLLSTRQHFWQEHNNPTGLLYAMYGPSQIQLKKTQDYMSDSTPT